MTHTFTRGENACFSFSLFAVVTMGESQKYVDVFNYLHNNSYPSGAEKNTKRAIRQRAVQFELREGQLFLKGTRRQWIHSKEQQNQIISSCHDDSLG